MARRTGGRARAAIFLIASLLAAVAFTLVVFKLLQGYQQALEEAEHVDEKQAVVIAAQPLGQGMTLTEEHLKLTELPPAFVPDTAFEYIEDVVGRVPHERVLVGEFIREERLADKEAGIGLNAIIPRGMRAVSINITDGSAVSGFLNPGNYVDILVTIKTSDKLEQTITLLEAVRVLAVDNRTGGGATGANDQKVRPSVTLAVTPEQAEKVAHAHSEGDVTMTLRNDIDVTKVEKHGDAVARQIGDAEAVTPPAPAPAPDVQVAPVPKPHKLDIIKGSESKEHTFK